MAGHCKRRFNQFTAIRPPQRRHQVEPDPLSCLVDLVAALVAVSHPAKTITDQEFGDVALFVCTCVGGGVTNPERLADHWVRNEWPPELGIEVKE